MSERNCVIPLESKFCSGCGACAAKCPVHALTIVHDSSGFRTPQLDAEKCIHCKKCVTICPWLTPIQKHEYTAAYACKNRDEAVLRDSASGGVFSALAHYIFGLNGVVFGARFDENLNVIHAYTETLEGLAPFRQSKYVESDLKETYFEAETFLKAERYVLFSGTPCQIAGLKRFLGAEYERLLTVGIICHGVPSPRLLRTYFDDLKRRTKKKLVSFRMRDKHFSWEDAHELYAARAVYDDGTVSLERISDNHYLRLFNATNCVLRTSCIHCAFAQTDARVEDITIGDYWGIKKVFPDYDYQHGVSALLVTRWVCGLTEEKLSRFLELTLSNKDAVFTANRKPYDAANFVSKPFYADMERVSWSKLVKKYAPPRRKPKKLSLLQKCYYKIVYELSKRFKH